MRPGRRGHRNNAGAYALLRKLLTLGATVFLAGLGTALAQAALPPGSAAVSFTLGVANEPVADAWNPLRLELRDSPPATLHLDIDQGSLASAELPLKMTYQVRGGAGTSFFEEVVFLPRFASLTWRLTTPERVLASGSLAGRDADERPLDLLLTNNPGAYIRPYEAAFADTPRLVDVVATDLPLEPAAYDGVRSLIIDGSSAAPRLEAVASAATAGVLVGLLGPFNIAHSELTLLAADGGTRIGAGAVLYGEDEAQELLVDLSRLPLANRATLIAALLEEPLVELPPPLPQSWLALALGAYVVATLLLLRVGGAPGLAASLALAALVSLAGWQLLRPAAPQLIGNVHLGIASDDLALLSSATEVRTLPHTTLNLPGRARPLRQQPYTVDTSGVTLELQPWRSVILEVAPTIQQAALTLRAGEPYNSGSVRLQDVQEAGDGRRYDLSPSSGHLEPTERASLRLMEQLHALLPPGSWLAQSGCEEAVEIECTVWVAFPTELSGTARGGEL